MNAIDQNQTVALTLGPKSIKALSQIVEAMNKDARMEVTPITALGVMVGRGMRDMAKIYKIALEDGHTAICD